MSSAVNENEDYHEFDSDVVVVASHEDMDDTTLRRHLNARHLPINGVPSLSLDWKPKAEPFSMWREYHAALHNLAIPHGVVKDHVHTRPGERQ